MPSNRCGPSNSSKCDAKRLLDFWYSHSHLDPETKLSSEHTDSRGTRAPQQFDLHLDESLQLKYVKYSPNVLSDLSNIALQSLASRKELPSPKGSNFRIRNQWNFNSVVDDIEPIANEADIADVYRLLVGNPTAQIAAVLELGADKWDNNILAWFLRSTPGSGHSAIADGFLRIPQSVLANKKCPDKVRTLTSLFGDLAVWEFKNMFAGCYGVMKSIMLLSEKPSFEWETCAKPEKPCRDLDNRKLPLVNGARMGFDSEKPYCSINHAAWIPSLVQEQEAAERDIRRDTGTQAKQNSGGEGVQIKTVHQRDASHIVQQAWAEATKHDCTFVIIHSGIYEIIGIRCRATQTLYLSDLIEPWRAGSFPPYSQLQVGLYIAIMRDAIDRANRLSDRLNSCHSWGKAFSNTFTYEKEDKSVLCAQSRKVKIDKLTARDPTELLRILRTANELSLRPQQQTQITAEFFSGTYYRYGMPVSVGSEPPLIIKIVTPSLRSSVVEGTVHVKPDGIPNFVEFRGTADFPRKVAIKLAPLHKKSVKQLQQEYDRYQLIRQRFEGKKARPRVPELIGFFIRNDGEYAVLVMEQIGPQDSGRKGETLKRPRPHLEIRNVRESYKRCTNILHASGMVHGSLSLEHFLCDPSRQGDGGPVTALISLENAKPAEGPEIIAERQNLIDMLAPYEELELERPRQRLKRSSKDTVSFHSACSVVFVGPLTRIGSDGGIIYDILQSDPDCAVSKSPHRLVERIHHSDDSVVEFLIPFFTPESCLSFWDKWTQQTTDSIRCEWGKDQEIGLDFPVFLGPVSARANVEGEELLQSLLREAKLRHSIVIPRHKSAIRIKVHLKRGECLAVPFLNLKDCEKFGSIWNAVGSEDVTCYCYTRGHKIGLPYEFD